MKETLILVVDSYLSERKETETSTCFHTPTDILRYLWYKKTGFLQIIPPKTIVAKNAKNNQHIMRQLDKSEQATTEAKQVLKLKYGRDASSAPLDRDRKSVV